MDSISLIKSPLVSVIIFVIGSNTSSVSFLKPCLPYCSSNITFSSFDCKSANFSESVE